tara:strand:+ start:323 stop:538 length:216 start_codon:yes stop_codon:yes gene_type:complete
MNYKENVPITKTARIVIANAKDRLNQRTEDSLVVFSYDFNSGILFTSNFNLKYFLHTLCQNESAIINDLKF